MKSTKSSSKSSKMTAPKVSAGARRGTPAEQHQQANGPASALRTNQGVVIADNQNSLKAGSSGPTLLEDFIMREKITHFDHERIPERIVHARGSAAHGYFQPYRDCSDLTRAQFLSSPSMKTPVFVRFSTVAGGAGSADLVRDVRGFAVKFYTQEGNFDLVGNNIPVFFIQDAIKFPDLIHSVKMEPDRGFPQAASAHDTFWDFVSMMPESLHMIMWAMSDRAIPRSYRMMEGFGIHTFRLVDGRGKTRFVKFHWRPKLGTAAVLWDEAVKINGADCDFHRRDLWEAIDSGHYPEWELGLQVFDEKLANKLPFDVLDPTKLIPEEIVPLEMVGKMVLDRNPDNFFAETEQVAFCPANIVPGIDFSDDPLLQGRLFSYLDTQLSRLGGPNFHQIPVNQPKCPFHNLQRDAQMQMMRPKGRVAYEPNSLDPAGLRESSALGFRSVAAPMGATKLRERPASFSDHYSQARLFYRSVTPQEQEHIANALTFELSKVMTPPIRLRVLAHLGHIDPTLQEAVRENLGITERLPSITPAVAPIDMKPSPALRLYGRYPPTLKGRKAGILIAAGFDPDLLARLTKAIQQAGAQHMLIAQKVGGAPDAQGRMQPVDGQLAGSPSVLFDFVVILSGERGLAALQADPDPSGFLMDAYRHLKAIGYAGVAPLLEGHGVAGEGIFDLDARKQGLRELLDCASAGKVWERQ